MLTAAQPVSGVSRITEYFMIFAPKVLKCTLLLMSVPSALLRSALSINLKCVQYSTDNTVMATNVKKFQKDSRPRRRKSDCPVEEWDDYFLAIAQTVARKSKDPRCQVGAVITSPDKLVLSTGFNGLARGVYDSEALLNDVDEKLPWICHAEFNAIVNASRTGVALKGASIYVTKFPCLACCNAIVQAGIEKIYTHDSKFWCDDKADPDHTRKKALLKQSGIHVDAPFHPEFKPKEPIT